MVQHFTSAMNTTRWRTGWVLIRAPWALRSLSLLSRFTSLILPKKRGKKVLKSCGCPQIGGPFSLSARDRKPLHPEKPGIKSRVPAKPVFHTCIESDSHSAGTMSVDRGLAITAQIIAGIHVNIILAAYYETPSRELNRILHYIVPRIDPFGNGFEYRTSPLALKHCDLCIETSNLKRGGHPSIITYTALFL